MSIFENLELRVTRSIWHQVVGNCKTEASAKPFPMDSYMADDLLSWRRQCIYSSKDDYVFAGETMRGKAAVLAGQPHEASYQASCEGKWQMSAALFNRYADAAKARAISAGTHPADQVHPVVVDAMREIGIDLNSAKPQKLTAELAQGAEMLITMGCGDECPYVPGLRRDDWALPDPKGQGIGTVRQTREEIERRVLDLLTREELLAR
jgi:arsenate reductase (thioredoxin)